MSNIEWLPRSSSDQTQSYKDSYGQPAWHQEAPLDSPSPPDTPSASSSRPPFDLRICDYSSTTASMSNLGFDPTGGATRSSHTRTNTDPSFAFASGSIKDEALIDLEAAAGHGRHAHHLSVSSSCGISSVGGGSTSGGSSDLDNESEWHTFASQQGLDRRGISSSSSSAANPEDLYTGLSRAFSQHHLTGGGPAAAGFPGASFKFEDFIASDVDGNNIDPALRGAHQHQQHRSESALFAAGMAQNQFAPEWMVMAGVKDELNLTHHSIGEPSWDPQQASYGGGSSTNTDSPLIVAGFAGHYATNPEIVESTAARPFTLVRSMSLQGHHPSSSNVHHHSSPSGGSEVHLASTGRVLPIHPALLRAGRPDYTTRSNSSPNVHEPSCNPSQITPGDYGFIDSTQSSPVFTSNVFNRYDLPDSPASSSAFSSPLTWHTPLHSDDGYGGEETYRPQHAGFASAQQQAMSSSMPSLIHSHHDGSPAWLSVSTSPSGFAGQAIRSSSSRPTTAGTPYDSPSIRATTSTARERRSAAQQQQQPLQTQDPYSGVITKRSRGRRVPKTPEEMTNVAKSGKVYSCRVPGCGLLFKRSEHLRRHLRSIHTNEKPFQCPVCSKAFSRRDNVHQHLKVHGASGRSARSAVPSRAVSLDGASGTAGSESPSGSPLEDWQRSRGGTVTRRNHGRPGGIIDDGVFAFDNGDDDDEDDDLHDFTL